jgi:hypothetical protein
VGDGYTPYLCAARALPLTCRGVEVDPARARVVVELLAYR